MAISPGSAPVMVLAGASAGIYTPTCIHSKIRALTYAKALSLICRCGLADACVASKVYILRCAVTDALVFPQGMGKAGRLPLAYIYAIAKAFTVAASYIYRIRQALALAF